MTETQVLLPAEALVFGRQPSSLISLLLSGGSDVVGDNGDSDFRFNVGCVKINDWRNTGRGDWRARVQRKEVRSRVVPGSLRKVLR